MGHRQALGSVVPPASSPSMLQRGDERARLADTARGHSEVRTKPSLTSGNIAFSFRGVTGVHNPLSLPRALGRAAAAAAAARSLALSSCSLLGNVSQVIWSPLSSSCSRKRIRQTHLLAPLFQGFPRFRHRSLSPFPALSGMFRLGRGLGRGLTGAAFVPCCPLKSLGVAGRHMPGASRPTHPSVGDASTTGSSVTCLHVPWAGRMETKQAHMRLLV